MSTAGTDAYGPYLDTGTNTTPTQRASVEVEIHQVSELDTGSKIAPVTLPTTHVPHRASNSPR